MKTLHLISLTLTAIYLCGCGRGVNFHAGWDYVDTAKTERVQYAEPPCAAWEKWIFDCADKKEVSHES